MELKKAWVPSLKNTQNCQYCVKAECNSGKPKTICVFVYPECRGRSKTQARMCSLHHSEEAESSVTHEAEESTGSDTRGTHNACACLFFPISCLSSALMWSCDLFIFFCRRSRKWTCCTYSCRIFSMKSCIFRKKSANASNSSKWGDLHVACWNRFKLVFWHS